MQNDHIPTETGRTEELNVITRLMLQQLQLTINDVSIIERTRMRVANALTDDQVRQYRAAADCYPLSDRRQEEAGALNRPGRWRYHLSYSIAVRAFRRCGPQYSPFNGEEWRFLGRLRDIQDIDLWYNGARSEVGITFTDSSAQFFTLGCTDVPAVVEARERYFVQCIDGRPIYAPGDYQLEMLSAHDWMDRFDHRVQDYDGWFGSTEGLGARSLDDLITEREYRFRYGLCTVYMRMPTEDLPGS
jgi:hypothetical protein